jgi:hypothetical protein
MKVVLSVENEGGPSMRIGADQNDIIDICPRKRGGLKTRINWMDDKITLD